MEDCLRLIKKDFPAIDADIREYVTAVLESTCEDLEVVDDVYDGIGELLHGVDPAKTEKEVRELCARLCFILKPNWTERATPQPRAVQRVFEDYRGGGQRQDVVTTSQRAELEPSDNTRQDSHVKVESESSLERNKEAKKTGKKKKGKGSKGDIKNKNKYGSSEVNSKNHLRENATYTDDDVGCQFQVTVTQRWNEKQIKASERAKEFANSKDVHLEVDD